MMNEFFINSTILFILIFSTTLSYSRKFRGRVYVLTSGLGISIWLFCALREMQGVSLETKMLWTSLSWIGAGSVSVSYFLFSYEFLLGKRVSSLISSTSIFSMSVIPAILGLTSGFHGWFFGPDSMLILGPNGGYAFYDREILWHLFNVSAHIFVISTIMIMIYGFITCQKGYKIQIAAMLMSGLIPIIFSFMYIIFDFRILNYNFTPFSFTISFILFFGVAYFGRSFDINTIGADLLLYKSRRPIVIVDENHYITSSNSAFQDLLVSQGFSASHVIKLIRDEVVPSGEFAEVKIGKKDFLISHINIFAPVVLRGAATAIGYIYLLIDISRQKQTELELREISERDWLTRVGSRGYFMQRLELRSSKEDVALFIVDIDFFKKINDGFGHGVGDEVLAGIGSELESVAGKWQNVGRLGGEEFVIMKNYNKDFSVEGFADEVCRRVREIHFNCLPQNMKITTCVGATVLRRGGDVGLALKLADDALYQAKFEGRDRHAVALGTVE